jgi:hypothetical protein
MKDEDFKTTKRPGTNMNQREIAKSAANAGQRCKTAKSTISNRLPIKIASKTLNCFYQNEYVKANENCTPKNQTMTSMNNGHYKTQGNFMTLSKTQLTSMRKQGIHMSETQPDILRYTFSNFHKAKFAKLDNQEVKTSLNNTSWVGPDTSELGYKALISGESYDAKHMDKFLK